MYTRHIYTGGVNLWPMLRLSHRQVFEERAPPGEQRISDSDVASHG